MQMLKKLKMKSGIKAIKLIALMSVLFSIGCSSMNSNFDCTNKPGVSCRSLGQVNSMVDNGSVGRDEVVKRRKVGGFQTFKKRTARGSTSSTNAAPSRAGERVVRIWMAPYQDIDGNYHGEKIIHTVVSKNTWSAPKEVIGAELDVE